MKSQFIGKDPDAGKDLRAGREEGDRRRGGWIISLTQFEQTQGDSEGQGSLACCSPLGCKESDMTEQLN